jgi:tetratricopeptide (TPR) repeat protein
MHVPLIAVVATFVGFVWWAAQRAAPRAALAVTGLLCVAAMVALTARLDARHAVLRDPVALWKSDLIIWPSNPRAYQQLTLALLASREPGEAVDEYRAFLEEQHEHPRALVAMTERMAGAAAPRFLFAQLDEALRKDPDLVGAYVLKGRLFRQRGRRVLAEEAFTRALDVDPDHPSANRELGLLRAWGGKAADAVRYLSIAVVAYPDDVVVHAQLGLAYQSAGRLTLALEHLSEAVRLQPDDLDLRLGLARALQLGQDPEAALRQLEEVLARDPDHEFARRMAAWLRHSDERNRAR